MSERTTLAEKVYEVLAVDGHKHDRPLNVAHTFPFTAGENITEFEMYCRDWGFVFGVAYGIARGEDPYEPHGKVGIRAMGAAMEAFKKWGGDDIFKTDAFAADRALRIAGGQHRLDEAA